MRRVIRLSLCALHWDESCRLAMCRHDRSYTHALPASPGYVGAQEDKYKAPSSSCTGSMTEDSDVAQGLALASLSILLT